MSRSEQGEWNKTQSTSKWKKFPAHYSCQEQNVKLQLQTGMRPPSASQSPDPAGWLRWTYSLRWCRIALIFASFAHCYCGWQCNDRGWHSWKFQWIDEPDQRLKKIQNELLERFFRLVLGISQVLQYKK